jgi:hypothetical protein
MLRKMARSAAHPPFRAVHVAAAVRATRLPRQNAEKRENSHWFGGSYGESRINIEKAADIQEQLATKIAELAATPADVGEAVPLRLDVPATTAAELWDSGLPVAAHERDTLETLAASYHVPLWAVAQVNPVAKNASLTEGQRIIVPRHLAPVTPPSPVSSYAPSEH